jgi:hypothetical protein
MKYEHVLSRILKTEYQDEYLMKRFGGIEFLPSNLSSEYNLISMSILQQIINLFGRTNQSMFNVAKIAALFRINPPQASVKF